MFCNQCGKELKDGIKFCTSCGAPVDQSSVYSTPKAVQDEPAAEGSSDKPEHGFDIPNPEEQPKTSPALKKWLLVSVILTVLFSGCLYMVLKSDDNPERVSERYFVSVLNGDYEGAFDCLGISRTDWLNPETFEAYVRDIKKNDSNLVRIRSVRAEKSYANKNSAQYKMDYTYGDARSTGSYYVEMVNESGSWRVSPAGKVIENTSLAFPKGAAVKLNGVELTDKYLDTSQDDGWFDVYKIPEMFYGTYEIEVELDGYEPYLAEKLLSSGGFRIDLDQLSVTRETTEELEKQAGEDLKKLYTALCARQSFDSVKDLFTDRNTFQQSLVSGYENQLNSFRSDSLISLKMDHLEAESSTGTTEVMISGDYTTKSIYSGYSGDREEDYSSSKRIYMRYVRDGESWKLLSVPDLSVYYY